MRLTVTAAVTSLAVATERSNPPDIAGEPGAVKTATNAAANDNLATAMKP